MERFVSFCGLIMMVVLSWSMSTNRRLINWRVVGGGIALQFLFAVIILKTWAGAWLFEQLGAAFYALIRQVDKATLFLFELHPADAPADSSLLTTVAFGVLPTIVFFSSLMSILYYWGIMPKLVEGIAWVMQRTLKTSGAESLSAAANIFVGQTEAPLVIRPYVASMTYSELNAVMVGGFATIAGGVMAVYVQMKINPTHLMTASVISAPAALLVAKLMVPETAEPRTMGTVKIQVADPSANVLEAAASGATDGMKLAINVAAMLIAFLALLSLVDGMLGWLGQQWDVWCGVRWGLKSTGPWSLHAILGVLFAPLAWIMGIPAADCRAAGELLGIRLVANEFVAFKQLSEWQQVTGPGAIQPRTAMILTYALTGFANFASIGIQIGGISALAPERRADLARLGLRAMIGGTLASFMTACIAGILVG